MFKKLIKNYVSANLVTILAIAIPTMAITLSRTLMGFVDFLYVSQLGTDALAAITPAGISAWVLIGLGMGTVSIVSTYASQSLLTSRESKVNAYGWHALYFSVFVSVVCWPLVPLMENVLALFGHSPEVLALEQIYARIILYGIGPTVAAFGLQSFFVGLHRPYIAMSAALVANIINAGANYVLIFGKFGFPEMGLAGAAWGTVFSTSLQLCILMAYMLSKPMRQQYGGFETARFQKAKLKQILRYGTPVGFNWIGDILAWAIFVNLLVGQFGTHQLAASNIALQFMHLSFMPAVGIGQALSVLVGKAISQKAYDEVITHTHNALRICVGFMGLCGLSFWIFGAEFISLLSDEPEVIRVGKDVMKLAALFQIFDALAICSQSALRGAGDTFWPAVISFLMNWLVFIGGGFMVVRYFPEWGSVGPWILAGLCINLIGVSFYLRFRSGSWRRIDVFANEEDSVEPKVVKSQEVAL